MLTRLPGRDTSRASPVAEAHRTNVLSYASAAALIALVTYFMVVGGPILLPFVMAVLSWHLINALATVSGRLQIRGRMLPAGLRFAAAILVLSLLAWLMVNLIVSNVGYVVAKAPLYEQNLRQAGNLVSDWIGLEELPSLQVFFEGGTSPPT